MTYEEAKEAIEFWKERTRKVELCAEAFTLFTQKVKEELDCLGEYVGQLNALAQLLASEGRWGRVSAVRAQLQECQCSLDCLGEEIKHQKALHRQSILFEKPS